jgi:hypothetical protein
VPAYDRVHSATQVTGRHGSISSRGQRDAAAARRMLDATRAAHSREPGRSPLLARHRDLRRWVVLGGSQVVLPARRRPHVNALARNATAVALAAPP